MELLLSLWTAAPEWKVRLIILALTAQMGMALLGYARLSKSRIAAVRAGKLNPEIYKAVGDDEPEDIRVFTRALANQFEAPVLFYATIIAGLALGVSSWLTAILAVIFVIVRWIHFSEMTAANTVIKRRKIFVRSIQVLLLIILEFFVSAMIFV